MKHAVIFAHPKPSSFTAAIAHAYAETARKAGHDVLVRDLYAEGFDPCLKAEEISGPGEPRPGADIAAERAKVADVDVFVFVYPLWFNAPPAMLKGYVDRVFAMGFGYGPGMEPKLDGKKMISFSSSGAPSQWVRETGALRCLHKIFDEDLAQLCGLEVVDHVHFGEITLGITEEAVARCTLKVREAFRTHFTES